MTTSTPPDLPFDTPPSGEMTGQLGHELTEHLLDEILGRLHPAVAGGLLLAAVPDSYDLPLLAALRDTRDGKDEKMLARLYEFSFISLEINQRRYRIEQLHRHILQEKYIERDREGYLEAQRRVLAYWRANPFEDPTVQAQNLLYHGLLADSGTKNFNQVGAVTFLVGTFRSYVDDRQLAAIERLLTSAGQARPYLALLEVSWLEPFDDLLAHLNARYSQFQGQWAESRETLEKLNRKLNLRPELLPYVARAYGDALAHGGDFVGAIAQYKIALNRLAEQADRAENEEARRTLLAEKGVTMIALGDAHAGLALAARGQLETLRDRDVWARIRDWFSTLFSLPMIIYLWFYLGGEVWRPRFWAALHGEDWLIIRLFALSAYWYHQADPLLETYGTRPEAVAADERLAFLYLELGDARRAADQFERLRREVEAPLGDYRRASVELGLAEAKFLLDKPGQTFVLIERALPVLTRFQDDSLVARARTLLGEARLAMGDFSGALDHFNLALEGYQALDNHASATEVVERLERLTPAERADLEPQEEEKLTLLLSRLTERHYPIAFSHPFLRWLRAGLLLALAVTVLLVPLLVLRFQVTSGLSPAIAFRPSPLLDLDAPFTANLSQGIQEAVAAQAGITTSAESLLGLAFILVFGYIVLSLGFGLGVITLTRLSTVQKRSESGLVQLNSAGIKVGREADAPLVGWTHIQKAVLADVCYLPDMPLSSSAFLIGDDQNRLVVRGTTRRYKKLRQLVEEKLPAEVHIIKKDYNAWSNVWVWLFILGMLVVWPLMLLTWFAGDLIWQRFFGIYSIADLYPYLYLLLFLPICWWSVGRRSWQLVEIEPDNLWPWVLLGGGLALVAWQILTRFRDLFTVPDIYTPLFTLTLMGASVWYVSRAYSVRRSAGRPGGRLWPSLLMILAAAGAGLLMVARISRDVTAYHYLIAGRYWNEVAVERRQEGSEADELFGLALADYNRASAIMETSLIGISGSEAVQLPLGVPRMEDHIWMQALRDRAILKAQQGEFDQAIADFEKLLRFAEEPAQVHGWLAVSYQSRQSESNRERVFVVEPENYLQALDQYNQALALDPGRADFLLWRGVTRHALNRPQAAEQDYKKALQITARSGQPLDWRGRAKALTGWGWILWGEDDIPQALVRFQRAVDADPTYSDAYLGVGYAYYRLRLYELAETAVLEAAALAPEDSLPLVALGTINWRLGSLVQNSEGSGREVCGREDASPEEKLAAQTFWERSAAYFTKATTLPRQNPEDIAYTFRTRGQVEYLLRDCPAYDKNGQYQAAVDSYTEALRYNPVEDRYWQLRARLRYALWLRTPPIPANDNYLYDAWQDIEAARILDPEDEQHLEFKRTYTREIVGLVGEEAWQAYLADHERGETEGRTPADYGCTYRTRFVADVSIPDDTVVEPGTSFEKIWRLLNDGTCPWTAETRWRFVDGDRMGAMLTAPVPPAGRGDEVDVAVTFIAPQVAGTYRSSWALQPAGEPPLENAYFVQIVVPGQDE